MASHHISVFQHHPGTVQQSSIQASSSSQLGNSHRSAPNTQPAGVDHIGKPIHFSSGQFAGRLVRAELIEIQKADLGRKYARVDRRPLDPPPVVLLKLYVTYGEEDQQREVEIQNYDEIQCHGLLCTVDLFPVPSPDSGKDVPSPASTSSQTATTHQRSGGGHLNVNYLTAQAYAQRANMVISLSGNVPMPSLPPSAPSSDVVHRIGDCEITEGSKETKALVGATFVQPSTVEFQGRKSLVFVFSDLAVKTEGMFILRYRVFDLFSRPYHSDDLAVQAECYGGQFKVYSTKEFPGLQASTELTKQLARWGVRLNIRETERKRRKKDGRSVSPTTPNRKRSFHSASEAGADSDED